MEAFSPYTDGCTGPLDNSTPLSELVDGKKFTTAILKVSLRTLWDLKVIPSLSADVP